MKTNTSVVVALFAVAASAAFAQSTWEGPTGAYLNPLACNVADGKIQGSAHYLDLQPAGSLTTFGANYGLTDRLEIGITQASLSIGGSNKVDNLHAKYLLRPLGTGKPALALGTVLRNAHGGADTADYYLAATHIFPSSKPVIASLTIRSTNALGSGLFGKASGRTTQFGGFFGVQVTPKLIPNVEYYQQPDGDDWKDIGLRYIASPTTYWDFGIADVGGSLSNQFALGVTHQF
ncbi:MAG: hypothetical protein ACYC63_11710 [Armatimonadota bacterium]